MSSRPVYFNISKLNIYFLTNAIFISGILKETLLSAFESTNFLYIQNWSHALTLLDLKPYSRSLC